MTASNSVTASTRTMPQAKVFGQEPATKEERRKTVKTSELSGAALNYAVGLCEGRKPRVFSGVVRATGHPDLPDGTVVFGPELNYSTDWSNGEPIIDREGISIIRCNDLYFPIGNEKGEYYESYFRADNGPVKRYGPTPLIAAMRCYVASQHGEEITLPEDLKC